MPQLAPHQYIPRYLTQPELRAFFDVITDPRDRALFAVIYHYGLRVSEVALLERRDVDLERGRIVVKRVKGGFWIERPLFASSAELLRRHLTATHASGCGALFPGRVGALQKRQIQARFVLYRDRAGLDTRYGCHSLRHSIATHLLDAGVSLEFVQDHLGHRSIRSTSIYGKVSAQRRVALFRKLEATPWIVDPNATEPRAPKERGAS